MSKMAFFFLSAFKFDDRRRGNSVCRTKVRNRRNCLLCMTDKGPKISLIIDKVILSVKYIFN